MTSCCLCCFFFFQAEDGIRDSSVTGVQTCALPICFDGAEFHHFFLLMIAEIRVDESNYAQNQEDDSENDDETLHGSEPFLVDAACALNGSTPTPALTRRGGVLFDLQSLTNGWLLLPLAYLPLLRWRPCAGPWASPESRALHPSILPS